MDDKKHIAVMSTMYYPDMGAPSACIDKYVRALSDEYVFHIITKTEVLQFEPSQDYDVRHISSFRHLFILRCRERIDKGRFVLLNKLALLFVNCCKFIQTQYAFPSAQRWEVKAYRDELVRLNAEHPLHAVIAVSNNWTTQLAMLGFKKMNPSVIWIAFILDPYFFFHIYYKYKIIKPLWRYLNKKKEQEVLDEADYSMLSPEMYKNVPLLFHINKSRFFEIKFALRKLNLNNTTSEVVDSGNKCKLLFAGMFYKKIRNPEFFLAIMSQVKNIQLDLFVGVCECEDILNRYNHGNIHREQYVNRERYVEMIYNEYDILVNVGNVSTLQAPSKMLELLSTGKPILNFYFTKDSQYEMIEKYPLGLNIGYQEKGAIEKVEGFCKKMRGRSISYEEVEKLFPENKLEKQVDLLRSLIES